MIDFKEELEWKTRKERIDKALKPNWDIVKYNDKLNIAGLTSTAVTEFPTANGPADYVFFVNGRLLAVLEAKKVSTNPQEVLGQAKRYSRGIFDGAGNWDGYKAPFLYSSNGEKIWFLDIRDSKNIRRTVMSIHTPAAMFEMFHKDTQSAFDKLKSVPIDDNEKLRPYQKSAIENTEEALMHGKRNMLIATGRIELTNLEPGIYSIDEIVAPSGYLLEAQHKDIELKPGDNKELIWTNKAKPRLRIQKVDANTGELLKNAEFRVTKVKFTNKKLTALEIIKTDDKSGEPLNGAKFVVERQNGERIGEYTTTEKGIISIPTLQPDWYVVKEIKAPDGYVLDESPRTVQVKTDVPTTVKFTNRKMTSLQIKKIDAVTGVPLAGANGTV